MERFLQLMQSKVERFTYPEIRAEILRQQIQELEEKGKALHDGLHALDNIRLQNLRQQLARIRKTAELNSQGRVLVRKNSKLMTEMMESGGAPSGAEDHLNQLREWIDSMERQRTQQDLRMMRGLRQSMLWVNRRYWGHNITLVGRHFAWRYLLNKPAYYLSRPVLRFMLWGMKRTQHLR